jgi:soluble lytic murein transglycosylase-like protein
MSALLLAVAIGIPTPSPSISPLPSAVVQWYAQRGAAQSGLDPALVRAVIDAESRGDPHAVSKAGAMDMMQLARTTVSDCGIHDAFDAGQNVACGAQTLGYLVHRYGMQNGIAAYNFGAANVASAGGHFANLPIETQNYVKDVVGEYDRLQHETLTAEDPAGEPLEAATSFDALLARARLHPAPATCEMPDFGIFLLICTPPAVEKAPIARGFEAGAVGGD